MKKAEKIRAVVFDIGGVLQIPHYYIKKGKKEFSGIHESIAKSLGSSLDIWLDAVDSVYVQDTVGAISRKKLLSTISQRLYISQKVLVRKIKNCYKKNMTRNKQLFFFITQLKKQGYIVGVLSDQWHLSRENIFPLKDEKLFDVVIISYEVKMRKPNPKIYKLLLKQINQKDRKIKPSEVLYIDDKEYNLEPAKKLGMKTILFGDNQTLLKEMKELGIKS